MGNMSRVCKGLFILHFHGYVQGSPKGIGSIWDVEYSEVRVPSSCDQNKTGVMHWIARRRSNGEEENTITIFQVLKYLVAILPYR